jgi:NTP pyrophosphatase (non-canonical NTP hydrolase)
MDADQYQRDALRTESTPDFVRLGKGPDHDEMIARLIHATLGMASEVGELADALKKHIIYGKALDEINVLEENGDLSWYQAVGLAAVKRTMSEALERNIAKLRVRYGDAFDPKKALNRNLDAERKALEG